MTDIRKKLISIVTPVYNEAETIHAYHQQLSAALAPLEDRYEFEIVITDNCSTDRTFEMVRELAEQDPRIRAFRFSRNFGYQKSILTGYMKARGDAAIEFDCDLQDPPELLADFLAAWEQGHDIVYGVRRTREEGAVILWLRKSFYRLLRAISETPVPVDAGDFMLLDRRVLDVLKMVEDHNIYIRGTVFGFGFRQFAIPYDRRARTHGQSKFTVGKLFRLAFDGIVAQSTVPLRISSYIGIFIALMTALMSFVYIAAKLIAGEDFPAGFTTLVVLLLFSISLSAIFHGITGEYIARMYTQVRRHPLVIIDQSFDRRYPEAVSDRRSEITTPSRAPAPTATAPPASASRGAYPLAAKSPDGNTT